MPLAGDAFLAGSLPAPNSPLNRITFQPFKSKFDLDAFVAQWTQFIEDYFFGFITDLTGVDLTTLMPIIEALLAIPQNIINAFLRLSPVSVLGSLTDTWAGMFDVFTGIFNQGRRIDSAVSNLEAAVFGAAGEDAITFSFTGAAAALTDVGWTAYSYGASGMVMSQKDDYAYMGGSAGADEILIMVYDDPTQKLSSHIQSCTHLTRERIASSGQCAYWMPLRVNAAAGPSTLAGCYARVSRGGSGGRVDLGIQLAGTATDLSAIPGADDAQVTITGLTFSPNDRFDWTIGDPDADPLLEADQYNWRWRMWLNTEPVIDYVFNPATAESSPGVFPYAAAADLLDETTYNCPSFGMTEDFIFVFVPDNVPPTTVEGLVFTVPKTA
jgi:hypothetical protein